ncbi:MAG TPA: 1,4-dihydroxy-2-naphthoate octaprenyltransferase [Opitutae bacterium]|nr:1,4-dihydroxy-2-naphthoate octaprenyltransferase [Opitutaceae bacterium]HCR30210.1 1,4-dihydroxy-2-naphthoate octaprenyltransferase [Opitutae bacterium]
MTVAADWIAAARLKTLPAAVAPAIVGAAEATRVGMFDWWPLAICLAFALLVQIATNMANDYFDHIRGADTVDRVGPERLVASGRISPTAMLRAAIGIFVAAFLIGLSMVAYRGSEMLVVGIAAIVFGYAYTGGPYPLAYHGLGDVFVIVFFGLVATMGTFYVIAGQLSFATFLLGLPLGLMANNILVVNNYRDKETDEAAGKRTLVARFGRRFARQQYGWQLALAYLCLSAYVGINRSFWPLIALITIPIGARLIVELRSLEGAALNEHLASSARLLLMFSALLALGIALS